MEREGRFSTAHLYKNAMLSYSKFMKRKIIRFTDVNRINIKNFEIWLFDFGLMPNTISTYMRMLRSIYNKAVDGGYAKFVRQLFLHVYTGIDTHHKKALTRDELKTLLYKDPHSNDLRDIQYTARLMYQLCGIPFVDLTHLSTSNITDGILEYHRMKTGCKVSIKLLDSTSDTIRHLKESGMVSQSGDQIHSLLGILSNAKNAKDNSKDNSKDNINNQGYHGYRSLTGFKQYQSSLHEFNRQLGRLRKALGITVHVSTYTIRHSWATMAKYVGVPIEMISESLGHKSIKTTQIYLAGFHVSDLAKMNRKVCSFIEKA